MHMFICIYVYVYIHICMCILTCIYIYVYVYVNTNRKIDGLIHTYIPKYLRTDIHTYIHHTYKHT